jgi:hypothetical protein
MIVHTSWMDDSMKKKVPEAKVMEFRSMCILVEYLDFLPTSPIFLHILEGSSNMLQRCWTLAKQKGS